MIVVKLVFNTGEHAILIFIRWDEFCAQEIFMERFWDKVKFLLVPKDYFFRWYTHRQLQLQSLFLLFLLLKQKLFTIGHESAWTRFFKDIIDGPELHISHFNNNFEILFLHYVFHVWDKLVLVVLFKLLQFNFLV